MTNSAGLRIKAELKKRGWNQAILAEVIGKDAKAVGQIINGKRKITPNTAILLGAAFGLPPIYWLKLQVEDQLANFKA